MPQFALAPGAKNATATMASGIAMYVFSILFLPFAALAACGYVAAAQADAQAKEYETE